MSVKRSKVLVKVNTKIADTGAEAQGNVIQMSSRLTTLLDNDSLICLGPTTITLVLADFNNKKL